MHHATDMIGRLAQLVYHLVLVEGLLVSFGPHHWNSIAQKESTDRPRKNCTSGWFISDAYYPNQIDE